LCEAEFKRKKVELERGTLFKATLTSLAKQGAADGKADPNKEGDDLEMIGGTSEDDFSEAIALIRYSDA
jgi:condensin complex subunit 1